MSPPNQPRLRASKPKTTTGCKTCKIRRVKCDEGKPTCARCIKFGADCEGYDVGGRRDVPTASGLRKIFPRKYNHQAFISPALGKLPFTTVFRDNREYSYFQYFQEKAALDIAGTFDLSLWNRVIIQASWNEQSLCRLVASLGALHKAQVAKASNLSKEEADPHQQYALQQYGRALKSVQARISANQYRDATRIALIASLLIYSFENLYGELDFALGHLEGALQLMRKQLAHATRHYKHSENRSPTSALDDDLVAAFFRLDCGLLSRDAISYAENIGSRLVINYLEIIEVPEKFNTLSEARNFLENIQFPTIPSLSRDLVARINKSLSPGNMDEEAGDMYTTMSSQLHRWSIAFKPLYEAESLTPNSENFVAAATLRVRALSTELASQRVCATGLSSSYLLNTISRELVNLSKIVAADPSFQKSFVWDCGIIPGLSIVVAACLDMSIRQEALQLLKQMVPRREGVWDSLAAVRFGESCLQME